MSEKYQKFSEIVIQMAESHDCNEICDYGCGDGEFLETIRQMNEKVSLIGIDFFKYRELIPRQIPGCHYIERENLDITLTKEKYDLIISSFTLHHFQYPISELKQIYDMLKPQGIIIFIDQSFTLENEVKTVKTFDSLISEIYAFLNGHYHRHFYKMDEINDLIKCIPVKVLNSGEIKMDYSKEKLKLFQDFDIERNKKMLERMQEISSDLNKRLLQPLYELQKELLTEYGIDYGDFFYFILQRE